MIRAQLNELGIHFSLGRVAVNSDNKPFGCTETNKSTVQPDIKDNEKETPCLQIEKRPDHQIRPFGFSWWAQQGLNLRPLPCEGSALPLSYAPVLWLVQVAEQPHKVKPS